MLSPQNHQNISKDAMIAGFPPTIPYVQGEITLMSLLETFKHLIECAQSTVTTHAPLNFLYLVVPKILWQLYSQAGYPQRPI